MPNIDLSILNQRQTPAFYADVFANRPAAGFVGRIFVSTDTFAFYRDNGTSWDLIGGPGTGTITGSGSSGSLALWNGTNTITYDVAITWDGTDNSISADKFIVNSGTSSQFLKGDGSLDSSAYVTTNIYNGNGTLSGERTVSLNGNNLIFDGGASIARVRMDADTNVARIFSFATNNLPRWAFRIDGTESGSNAGSDFAIRRYNDAGTFVDAPLTVTRSTGQSTFAKKVVIENNAGDQQLQIVSTTAPSLRIDNLQTGATKRIGLGLATAVNNFIQGSADRDFCIFNGSTAAASPILFGIYDAGAVNVQEAARISPARNLLVGTTTDAGYKLDINGTGIFRNSVKMGTASQVSTATTATGADIIVGTGADSSPAFQVWDDNSLTVPRFNVTRIGNVGIGTNAPATTLEVLGLNEGEYFRGGGGTISGRSLTFSSFTVSGTVGVGHRISAPNASANLIFSVAGSDRLSISNTGAATFRTPSSGSGVIIRHLDGTNNPGLFIETNESTKYVTLTASGSSPAGQLLQLGAVGNAGTLNISASNVLIGTTTDNGSKLQVVGQTQSTRVSYAGLQSICSYSFGPGTSTTINIITQFPELTGLTLGNVWGISGTATNFLSGTAECVMFTISRNSGGGWSAGVIGLSSPTASAILTSVTGSGDTITLNFAGTAYTIVTLQAQVR